MRNPVQDRTDSAVTVDRRADLLDEWVDLGEQIAALEARRAEVLAEREGLLAFETHPDIKFSSMGHRSVVAEFAAAGRVSPVTMERQFALSSALVREFPATLEALREGRISRRHAEVILNEAPMGLQDSADGGATVRAAYEQEVLPFAGVSTPARTRVHARAVVAMLCPVTQEEAHREAREERSVKITPTADGMAQLTAVIPEILAQGIFDRLTAMAKATETTEEDDRSRDQRRADIFCDLLLCSTPSTVTSTDMEAFRPTVHVTINAATLQGLDDRMAELDGVGPIHPDIARTLAGNAASFTRLFLDPTGMVTNVDIYVPTSRMKRYLRARDQHCRFPGCRAPAVRCDIDHNHDHARGGPTALDNLAHLCPTHHALKHPDVDDRHRWDAHQHPDGTLTWTSPLKREYIDVPPARVMFT